MISRPQRSLNLLNLTKMKVSMKRQRDGPGQLRAGFVTGINTGCSFIAVTTNFLLYQESRLKKNLKFLLFI